MNKRFLNCYKEITVSRRILTRCLSLGLVALVVSGCASRPPSNIDDVCQIFRENKGWYRAAVRTEKRWGSPVEVSMSIMYQESAFKSNAKPERTKLFFIIPWARPSSAKGYAQALDPTWKAYQQETGNGFADRNNFYDAIDFIGWYNAKTYKRNKVAKHDAYRLYLAYHEGQGGLERGTWRNKRWLINTAKTVDRRSKDFAKQLKGCERELKGGILSRILFW